MERIAKLLTDIGAMPEEVAAVLRSAEVRGLRDSTSFMNPIVRYINRRLDIGAKLEVGADGTTLRMYGEEIQELTLPLPVQGFLQCFHRGLYPELEES